MDDAQVKEMVKAAVEKVDLGDVTYEHPESYYWTNPSLSIGEVKVELEFDRFNIADGLRVCSMRRRMTEGEILNLEKVLKVSKKVAAQFNSGIAEAIAAEKKAQEEAEAKRIEEAAKRKEDLAERKERLFNEFFGEKGQIRYRRSKSYQPVIVGSEKVWVGPGDDDYDYEVLFEWVNDHDYGRGRDLANVRSFDIKVGSRYQMVWDDGEDDLREYEQEKVGKSRRKMVKYDGVLADES